MLNSSYFNKLRDSFNYDDKTINALMKIIPCLIDYYGEEYEPIILNSILETKIVPCNSYQTISKVINENKLTKTTGSSLIEDIDIKRGEGVYFSNCLVSYDENSNTYNIDKINRVVVTSHTYNYDSPKGLEVLTYALCKLVKSYYNEYRIEENILIKRCGIFEEKRHIIKDNDDIYLDFMSDINKGLEEGMTIFDTERVVSNILMDNYKCYDYNSIYTIANILKNKFNLISQINECEVMGNLDSFSNLCDLKMEELSKKCDECLSIEQEMFISMFREEKDELANLLNKKLSLDVYGILMNVYKNSKKSFKN